MFTIFEASCILLCIFLEQVVFRCIGISAFRYVGGKHCVVVYQHKPVWYHAGKSKSWLKISNHEITKIMKKIMKNHKIMKIMKSWFWVCRVSGLFSNKSIHFLNSFQATTRTGDSRFWFSDFPDFGLGVHTVQKKV